MICKNCKNSLRENAHYCDHCGGKVIRNRLTLKNLFEHFSETFLNYDNKFIQTILHLFKDPVDVIEGYNSGVRNKYVGPLALLAISLSISGFYLLILQKYLPDVMDLSAYYTSETQKRFTEEAMRISLDYNSLLYLLFIPGLALISWIVFLNERYNFTEHLVIFFYTMPLFSMISVITNLTLLWLFPRSFMVISFVLYLLFFLYQSSIFKKLFKLTYSQLGLKILIFMPIFAIGYLSISVLILILVLVFGEISLQDFRSLS